MRGGIRPLMGPPGMGGPMGPRPGPYDRQERFGGGMGMMGGGGGGGYGRGGRGGRNVKGMSWSQQIKQILLKSLFFIIKIFPMKYFAIN